MGTCVIVLASLWLVFSLVLPEVLPLVFLRRFEHATKTTYLENQTRF